MKIIEVICLKPHRKWQSKDLIPGFFDSKAHNLAKPSKGLILTEYESEQLTLEETWYFIWGFFPLIICI